MSQCDLYRGFRYPATIIISHGLAVLFRDAPIAHATTAGWGYIPAQSHLPVRYAAADAECASLFREAVWLPNCRGQHRH